MKRFSVSSSNSSQHVQGKQLGSALGWVSSSLLKGGVAAAFIFVFSGALTGCEPRGETKTVAQVYEIAQAELSEALNKSISVEAREKISSIQRAVKIMADAQSDAEIRKAAGEAAAALHPLINWSGYTSRAAGGELLQQLSNMEGTSSQGERVNVNPASAKLLAARTLSWIASEMNSLAFGLKEREGR